MKKLITLATLFPGAALAHGVHMPIPAEAHTTVHVAPWLALVPITIAGILMVRRARS